MLQLERGFENHPLKSNLIWLLSILKYFAYTEVVLMKDPDFIELKSLGSILVDRLKFVAKFSILFRR